MIPSKQGLFAEPFVQVVIDPKTGRSRGYGFVSFRDPAEAERAMAEMNGAIIGKRAIRVSWGHRSGLQHPTKAPSVPTFQPVADFSTFESISAQSASNNSTVYIGNIPFTTTGKSCSGSTRWT